MIYNSFVRIVGAAQLRWFGHVKGTGYKFQIGPEAEGTSVVIRLHKNSNVKIPRFSHWRRFVCSPGQNGAVMFVLATDDFFFSLRVKTRK